jgi:acyl-CoA synthetase (AMP-forming)/AMP-acid ligase II
MVALSSFIQFHARRTPDRLALIYGDDKITYARMLQRIETVAGWLDRSSPSETGARAR